MSLSNTRGEGDQIVQLGGLITLSADTLRCNLPVSTDVRFDNVVGSRDFLWNRRCFSSVIDRADATQADGFREDHLSLSQSRHVQ